MGSAGVALVTVVALGVASLPVPAHARAVAAFVQDGPSALDIAKAKGLYVQAEEYVANGKHAEAIPLYEEAYRLVPGKHGFAFKVGVSAYKVNDCVKAKEYLQHLLTYGSDQAKLAEKVKEAKGILAKIKKSKCDQPKAGPEKKTIEAAPVQIEEDNPFAKPKKLTGTEKQAKDAVEASRERGKRTQKQVEKMKSYGLMGVGAASIIGGVALLLLARRNGSKLGKLSQPSDALGLYPEGDYACRDPEADCPYKLAVNMRRLNVAGYALMGFGVLAIGGGTYFWFRQRKTGKSTNAEPKPSTPAAPKAKPPVASWTVFPQWSTRSLGAAAHLSF